MRDKLWGWRRQASTQEEGQEEGDSSLGEGPPEQNFQINGKRLEVQQDTDESI